jgi:hypothetical protein
VSADNWAMCPRCAARRAADLARREAEVSAAYGTVPVDEFDRLRTALAEERTKRVDPTFREDYDLGLDSDEFYVRYRGRCSVCGLHKEFVHSEVLDVGDA